MRSFALAALLFVSACSHAPPQASEAAANEWHTFSGNWIATGTRNSIPLGAERRASVADLEGTMLLSGDNRPARGFRGEAVVFNDTQTGATGRAVWTDSNGDKVFSELHGSESAGGKIQGTFIGGTGRFAGANGSYEFTWQFVIDSDDGRIQGQTNDLSGRIRVSKQP